MEIDIKNLGNVQSGHLDISKKLTLFCGPNNTGKTYVSYIVYALLKSRRYYDAEITPDFSDFYVKGVIEFQLNKDIVLRYRKSRVNSIHSSLESVFGLSSTEVKGLFEDFLVTFSLSDNEFYETVVVKEELNYLFSWDSFDVRVVKKKGGDSVIINKENIRDKNETDTFFFEWQLMCDIYDRLICFPFSNACIFPVERNSIYTFNKELSIQRNELIEQMQALKDNKTIGYDSVDKLLGRSTRYPLAIRDCLSVANDLNNLQKKQSEYYSFAEELEKQLLKGRIVVAKTGDVQFVTSSRQKLPIQLSASIVKTLSSLTFYLKHIAKKGDLIIIDEPEMNLHPDAQVILTRVFARLMNQGINFLISTHSDYIISELNNLIALGSITNNESLLTELNYQNDECLSFNDISVYLFKPINKGKRKTQIIQIAVKKDGFAIDTIDDVIYKSNNDSDRILFGMNYEQRD